MNLHLLIQWRIIFNLQHFDRNKPAARQKTRENGTKAALAQFAS